jgi:GTP-binding protein HflX
LTGEGLEGLKRLVSGRLTGSNRMRHVELPIGDGASAAWLHEHGEVLNEIVGGDSIAYDVRLSDSDWNRFQARA